MMFLVIIFEMGQNRTDPFFFLSRMNLRTIHCQICLVCHCSSTICMCFAVVRLCVSMLLLFALLPSVCLCFVMCGREYLCLLLCYSS